MDIIEIEMSEFPLWIVPIFLLTKLIVMIKAHRRLGMSAIYTLATHTFILSALYLWLSTANYSAITDTWALGVGFCSMIFWNIILMYLTRNRHIL